MQIPAAASDNFGPDLEHAVELKKAHTEFCAEVSARQANMDNVWAKCASMVDAEHVEKDEIQKMASVR